VIHASRFTICAVLAVWLFFVGVAACGKKGNPVPPEDAPPAKQENK